jgi:hypothetical protein
MNTKHSYDIWLWEWRLKPIVQFNIAWEKIMEWKWASHAERSLWISSKSINRCCLWKRKTAWWFAWKYHTHKPAK